MCDDMYDDEVPAPTPPRDFLYGPTLKRLPWDDYMLRLLPRLTKKEYRLLERRILERKWSPSVYTLNGKIIMGIETYSICRRHRVPYLVVNLNRFDNERAIKWALDEVRKRAPYVKTWTPAAGEAPAIEAPRNRRAIERLFEAYERGKK